MGARRVAVAASGGRDSTALLHCTARAAQALGIEVLALHVHHGLEPAADDWLAHVRRQSRRWGCGFESRRLADSPPAGASVKAWARRERYRALAAMAKAADCDLVLLAHHRRDQAETWLLQALRGGGAAGLSAMPRVAQRDGRTWARPWLDLPREAVEAYVRRHRLSHIDDASNDDPRYARNRLRRAVWPALLSAFPDAEASFVSAALQAQESAVLATEVLGQDLPALLRGGALAIGPWLALPPARRLNALRGWLASVLGRGSPSTLVDRLMVEVPGATSARWEAPGGELRLYRGMLSLGMAPPAAPSRPEPLCIDLSQPGQVRLPQWQGCFTIEVADCGGLAPALLEQVQAHARIGGERFRLAPSASARSLRKQYQARGIPAWQREGPLLRTPQGRLIYAPGLGAEGSAQAPPGAPQLRLTWLADAPEGTGPRQGAG